MSDKRPPYPLDGKTAIITGASRGIGLTLARAFLDAGCAVMLAARDPARLRRAEESCARPGGRLSSTVCDVSDPAQVGALAEATVARFGTVDILINNAAILGPVGAAWETSAERWSEALRVNVLGPYLCCRAVLPIMVAKRRGKIINVAGRGAAAPWPRFSAYGVSKTAVVRFTETLAEEARPHNVQVNVMAPGANDTGMFREAARHEPDMWDDLPQDASGPSRLALFLASEASDHITGRFIHVNQNWSEWTPADVAGDRFTLRRI